MSLCEIMLSDLLDEDSEEHTHQKNCLILDFDQCWVDPVLDLTGSYGSVVESPGLAGFWKLERFLWNLLGQCWIGPEKGLVRTFYGPTDPVRYLNTAKYA